MPTILYLISCHEMEHFHYTLFPSLQTANWMLKNCMYKKLGRSILSMYLK